MEKNEGTRAQCGACTTLRRSCAPGCIFAPYFSAEEFAAVHRVYGAGNVSKMLRCVTPSEQRRVAAATLVEEARARERDAAFGCVSYITILQEFNENARKQVDEAREEIAREFGAAAAAEPVDVAAAEPAARLEARAQVDAALKEARELDARMLGIRKASDVRWRELQLQQAAVEGKRAKNGKGVVDVKRRRRREPSLSEPTMLVPQAAKRRNPGPPGFPDDRSQQQMAVAEAERTEPPGVPEGYGHGQLHHQTPEADASAGQHAGTGQPRHAGDAAPDIPAGPGHAGATGEQDQHQRHVAPQNEHCITLGHGDPYGISQDILQLQELLMGQCDAAAEGAAPAEQDVMVMMQQMAAAAWQQQDPTPQQYAGMRDISLGHGHLDGLSQDILQLQELLMGQCDAATMVQQMPAAAWQHQDPAPQYARVHEMPQQVSSSSLPRGRTWVRPHRRPGLPPHPPRKS